MGAGELSLWRKRRRRDAEANLRSLLHPALFVETRCHDRSENDLYDVRRKRAIGRPRYQLSVISYQLSVISSNCRRGASPAGPGNGKRERLPYNKIPPDLSFRNCSHDSASRAHASPIRQAQGKLRDTATINRAQLTDNCGSASTLPAPSPETELALGAEWRL